MTAEEKIRNRRIGIIGMARSGMASALMAEDLGGQPFVSDSKSAELLADQIAQLQDRRIPFETSGHTDKLLSCDYIVVSPGVPPTADILRRLRDNGIPIFSEIEFASWACRGRIAAITGSNGKTTTTTLLGRMFQAAGIETFVCGNIGDPFAGVAARIPHDGVAVIEVSNFQLEGIADFRPDVATILNLTPDHLDRHGTFDEYKKVKYRIAENQSEGDTLILNLEDRATVADEITTQARKKFFSTTDDNVRAMTYVRNGILWTTACGSEEEVIHCSDIRIPGPHNLQNAAAAVTMARLMGVDIIAINRALGSFAGVEHRLERVGQVAGVFFINDSKATNVDSVCYALRSVETPIHLIAGGRDKSGDFAPIAKWGKDRIKSIVLIGEAKEKMFAVLGKAFSTQFADTLEEAVGRCFEMAYPGETILLSPACASFDMFEDYEHRGEVFKKAVANLKNGSRSNEKISH